MGISLGNVAFGAVGGGAVFGFSGDRFFDPKFAAVGMVSGAAATVANEAVGGGVGGTVAGLATGEATAFGGMLALGHGHIGGKWGAVGTAALGAYSGLVAANF